MLDKPELLTTQEVAMKYRKHPVTVRLSLQEGTLHGRQRVTGGRWLIEGDCAEAWSQGLQCEHATSAPIQLSRRRA